jgi:hypothetical protein
MKPTQFPKGGKSFSDRTRKRLIDMELSITDLANRLIPKRPRSTVSTAIHTTRFPKVRRQIAEALKL